MNNVIMRILLAVIAIPALLILIFLLPHFSHLPLNIVITGLSVIGALELQRLFGKKEVTLNPVFVAVISAVFPVFSILICLEIVPESSLIPAIAAVYGVLLTIAAFPRNTENTENTLKRLPALSLLLFFPGFFMSFLIRLNGFEKSSVLFLIFLTMVFGNDSFAYIFGMLFGAKNRGIFKVSPKKSLAGLIGGVAVSAAVGGIYFIFFPEIFGEKLIVAILTGAGIAATSVIGDLTESAMKRSADTKDSGTIMRGRGGVLDTIDSILFSAPLFYYIISLIQ